MFLRSARYCLPVALPRAGYRMGGDAAMTTLAIIILIVIVCAVAAWCLWDWTEDDDDDDMGSWGV